MDRFVIRGNIHYLRDQLVSETDPALRARLTKQLIEEEDRLGANAALLDDVDREINRAIILVARQTALVISMERNGRSGAELARKLLGCLTDNQRLHERYREKLQIALGENGLL